MKTTVDQPRVRLPLSSPTTTTPTTPSIAPTTTAPTTTAPTTTKKADAFANTPAPATSTPTTSFAATTGGRGVGGTLGLLRPTLQEIGRARFTPIDTLLTLATSGAPAPKGLFLLDANLGAAEKTAHPTWAAATLDHHGPVHGAGKGRGTNSTTQLLDRFEQALSADVASAKQQPTFAAALRVVDKAAQAHGLPATTTQKEQAAAALLALNLTQISSDNVGDGLSWPVWMANNQARVLLDTELRSTIRAATVHEDFGVFGGNYMKGVDDVSTLPAPIKLQSALFLAYDDALAAAGVKGSDRVPGAKAEGVAADVGKAIDALLKDPQLVDERCHAFFTQVGLALTTIEDNALVKDASISDRNGRWSMPVFDVTKLPKELGTFAGWAVPPLFGEHTLQMTVAPGASADRRTLILAVPDERVLPSGKGLLSVLDRLNALEQARTPAGQPPAAWFGRDTVVLPSPPGSLLTPADLKQVVNEAKLLDTPTTPR